MSDLDSNDQLVDRLIAVGEAYKVIDRQTEGKLISTISTSSVAGRYGLERRTGSWIL